MLKEFLGKVKTGFQKTRETFTVSLWNILSRRAVTKEFWEELEELLISGDLGIKTTEWLINELRKRAANQNVNSGEELMVLLKKLLIELLSSNCTTLKTSSNLPTIYLIVGVNGSGKTTTIGKLAYKLKSQGKKVILAAADTFRPAAIEQLERWANNIGCMIVKHSPGGDPAAVVYDAVEAAIKRELEYVIVDTAGRLHTKYNLMEELKKIYRVLEKKQGVTYGENLLVLDASMGQNALVQAKKFKEAIPLTGIILAKLDSTAKGGIIISIHKELGLPVKLVGVGEKKEDLIEFDPKYFVDMLLDRDESRF